ncbi:MAG: beta-1,6-N-acetylglucosaminyltransferase [Anaerostipes sp.]|uniref:beta-1,6-N-acetylglucosaminyltransferase n=1 Tax=Anaerostipes sp. TaxID=1872530 RepID=UPI003992E678
MGKHAYLIMAHDNESLLKDLLKALDFELNDIYLHIDKKSNIRPERLAESLQSSHLIFTERVRVKWGGYSQIEAELVLLEAAVNSGENYEYIHLLTGVDMPLKKQKDIHEFYGRHKGREFISCTENPPGDFMDRVKYFYPDFILIRNSIGRSIRGIFVKFQHVVLKIDRTDKIRYGFGSAYFDISLDFAKYILQNKKWIQEHFRDTFCADEMFIQTVYLNSPFNKEGNLYKNNQPKHPFIANTYFDVVRAIDWKRGRPYTYKMEDYNMLMESGCLFARKFNMKIDSKIVKCILKKVVDK